MFSRLTWIAVPMLLVACSQADPASDVAPQVLADPLEVPAPESAPAGDVVRPLAIQIHDAPTDGVDAVWLEVEQVTVHHVDDGWLVVSDVPTSFDLLSLQGGVVAPLGLANVPEGYYDEVRLVVSDAWVEVDGVEEPLDVPSGSTSGVKVKADFAIESCGDVVVDLDWDVGAQLMLNPQGYKLRPTIHAEILVDDSGCDACAAPVFPDPALDAIVRQAAGVPSGPLTGADVAGITSLNAGRAGITDLSGTECLTGLQVLWVFNNGITDLTPLSDLPALRTLGAQTNQITDLSPLSGMVGLDFLQIDNNPIASGDLSAIAGATGMRTLTLNATGITDLSALANMPLLRLVYAGGNGITDLTPMAALTDLTHVHLFTNDISDLTPLASSTGMVQLLVQRNQLTDLSPLSGMVGLDFLQIDTNPIASGDLSAIAGATGMRTLTLNATGINDLTAMAGMPSMRLLFAANNGISDIGPLSGLGNLTHLHLFSNDITDFSPIESSCGLVQLLAQNNPAACPDPSLDALEACGVSVTSDCP